MSVRMHISGLMMDPVTNMPIVVLRDDDSTRTLPIWIGMFEAHAVAMQLENTSPARPMTHDLISQVIQAFGARVDEVHVTDVQDGTFYAVLFLTTSKGETLALDARPSDALALALRTKVPVLVAEHVVSTAATLESPRTEDQDRLQRWLESLDPDDMGKYKM